MKFKNSKGLLKHEQGHFDIAELFARKFKIALDTANLNNNTINKAIEDILAKILAEKKAFDMLYDKETDFSNNVTNQTRWSKNILLQIEKLKDYKK